MTYVNLFAYRSPHPHALNRLSYPDAVGVENDAILCHTLTQADVLAVGWGNPNGVAHDRYQQRIAEMVALLRAVGATPYRVGPLTRAGHPRHGLIWRGEMALWKVYWGYGVFTSALLAFLMFDALRELTEPPDPPRRPIGFITPGNGSKNAPENVGDTDNR